MFIREQKKEEERQYLELELSREEEVVASNKSQEVYVIDKSKKHIKNKTKILKTPNKIDNQEYLVVSNHTINSNSTLDPLVQTSEIEHPKINQTDNVRKEVAENVSKLKELKLGNTTNLNTKIELSNDFFIDLKSNLTATYGDLLFEIENFRESLFELFSVEEGNYKEDVEFTLYLEPFSSKNIIENTVDYIDDVRNTLQNYDKSNNTCLDYEREYF